MRHPEMMMNQQARSDRERLLPDYAKRELDLARSGCDIYGNRIDADQRAAVFDRWFGAPKVVSDKAVSDFTRVCREQGLDLDYGREEK